MKKLLSSFFLLLLTSLLAQAQIQSAEIGINGLTCSFCTRNVEMQLRKLDFIADVEMDLAETYGKITFKKATSISPAALQKAVKDAGFSLRYVYFSIQFSGQKDCLETQDVVYQFLNPAEKQGKQKMQVLAKGMLERKELKHWESQLNAAQKCPSNTNEFYFLHPITN